ncbi:hypothetical protein Tco_0637267 [Tanacetum coccineum]
MEGTINHNKIYIAPSHTKKVFANMKRQGKDFSENVVDKAVYEEKDDNLERATTTATGLDAEQDRGNIFKTQSKATPNEPSSIGTSSGGDPRRQDTMGDTIAQTRTDSSDDEATLGDQEDASKQGRKIHDIDADEDITLENVHDVDMFGVHDLDGDEVSSTGRIKDTKPKAVTTAATTTTTAVTRTKAKGLVIQEQEPTSTPITSSKDKGKAIMVEEPLKMKKKDQVLFDEQEAIRLQAQFDEEERIAREKEEANAALIAQWNDIQDKVETDYELAQRLQAEEQEELRIEKKSKLFQQLLEKRRKHFAAKRTEEKRNRRPIKAQQRSIMYTYLKNMVGWKPKDLKTKSFANVQELFDKAMKRVNTFVDMDTELVGGSEVREEGSETREESSSKRAGDELEQEPSKKQKMEDDKETTELQSMMEVIPDEEEVAVDAIPLATKPLSIVDWKIIKEGKIGYYQIIRADGNSKRYSSMIQMLKSFDREDLETLWKLVKAKHGYTRPEEGYERVLWGDLKTMFEHNIEDTVWRNLLGNKVLIWKLFDSCGVHFVRFQDMHIFMLVEKRYPLTPATITK